MMFPIASLSQLHCHSTVGKSVLLLLFVISILSNNVHAQLVPDSRFASLPSAVSLGESFTANLDFVSTSSGVVGYSPVVDLVFPSTAITNVTLLTFQSASVTGRVSDLEFLLPFPTALNGSTVIPGCMLHPLMPSQNVCATAFGQSLYTTLLPFSSFTPTQPAARTSVNFLLTTSSNIPGSFSLQTRGSFRYGLNPSNASAPVVGSWRSASVAVSTISLRISYDAAENEVCAGPSFVHTVTASLDIASAQNVSDVQLRIPMPPSQQFVLLQSATPNTSGVVLPSVNNNFTLVVNWTRLTGAGGGNDARISFQYYVLQSYRDSSASVLDGADDQVAQVNASLSASWAVALANGTVVPSPFTISNTASVVQKTACARHIAIADITNGGSTSMIRPGNVLRYQVELRFSDYYRFDNLTLNQTIPDGQRWETGASFDSSLQVLTAPGSPIASFARNVSAFETMIGAGRSIVTFDLTPVLSSMNLLSTDNVTMSPNVLTGAHRMVLTFHTTVQSLYDSYATNNGLDLWVSQADFMSTSASLRSATVLRQLIDIPIVVLASDNVTDVETNVTTVRNITGPLPSAAAPLYVATDSSSSTVRIAFGALSHTIYAIDDVVCDPQPCPAQRLEPGHNLTFRVQYTLPSTRFEDTRFNVFFQMPLLNVNTAIAGQSVLGAVDSSAVVRRGPLDTFSAQLPSLLVNATDNRLVLNYGFYGSPVVNASVIDVLIRLPMGTQQTPDAFFVTNVATSNENANPSWRVTQQQQTLVQMKQPVLTITTGAIGSDSTGAVYTPSIVGPVSLRPALCPPFTGVLSSQVLTSNPVRSSIGGIDGGDTITICRVIENLGSGTAYDVQIAGVNITGGSQVVNGSVCAAFGNRTAYPQLNDLSSTITLPALAPYSLTTGSNVLIVCFNVSVSSTLLVSNGTVSLYTGVEFAGAPGGETHSPLNASISMQFAPPTATLALVSTSRSDTNNTALTVGELVAVNVTVTLAEAIYENLTIFVDVPFTNAPMQLLTNASVLLGSSMSLLTSAQFVSPTLAPTFTVVGVDRNSDGSVDRLRISVGSAAPYMLYNAANNQLNDGDRLTVRAWAVLTAAAANSNGATVSPVAASLTYVGMQTAVPAANTLSFNVIEPTLTLAHTSNVSSTIDGLKTIVYTLTVLHRTTAPASTLTAYDLLLSATMPPASVTFLSSNFSGAQYNATSGRLTFPAVPQFDLRAGNSFIVQYTVQVNANISFAATIAGSSSLTYDLTPGVDSVVSLFSRNYTATATRNVNVGVPTLTVTSVTSFVDTTSAAFQAGVVDLAVSELVTFNITARLPEGTTTGMSLLMYLPSATSHGSTGVMDVVNATLVSIGSRITVQRNNMSLLDTSTDSLADTVRIDFGDVLNAADLLSNTEDTIVVRVVARVTPTAAVNFAVNGRNVTTSVRLLYSSGSRSVFSNSSFEFLLPQLRVVNRVFASNNASSSEAPVGGLLNYTLVVSHVDTRNSYHAFHLSLTNWIPIKTSLQLPTLQLVAPLPAGVTGPTFVYDGSNRFIAGISLPNALMVGSNLTIQFQAFIMASAEPGSNVIDTANITYGASPLSPSNSFSALGVSIASVRNIVGGAVDCGPANLTVTPVPANMTAVNLDSSQTSAISQFMAIGWWNTCVQAHSTCYTQCSTNKSTCDTNLRTCLLNNCGACVIVQGQPQGDACQRCYATTSSIIDSYMSVTRFNAIKDAGCSCPCDNPPMALNIPEVPWLDTNSSGMIGGTMRLRVVSTMVNFRSDANITFVGAPLNSVCNYIGGTYSAYWNRGVQWMSCSESWSMSMDWPTFVQQCGAVRSVEGDFIVYRGRFDVDQRDTLMTVRGQRVFRNLTTSFGYEIIYPTKIEVSKDIRVFAPVIVVPAITRQAFTAQLGHGELDLFTSIQTPFELVPISVEAPNTVISVRLNSSSQCTFTTNTDNANVSACEQSHSLIIEPNGECTLSGQYRARFAIRCSDSYTGECPLLGNETAVIDFTILTGDICALFAENIDLQGQLVSYLADYNTRRSAFIVGQRSFWSASVTSNKAEIIDTQLVGLRVNSTVLANSIVLLQSSAVTAQGNLSALSLATVSATETRFAFSFPRSLFTSIPVDSSSAVDVIVNLRVTYANTDPASRKRQVSTADIAVKFQNFRALQDLSLQGTVDEPTTTAMPTTTAPPATTATATTVAPTAVPSETGIERDQPLSSSSSSDTTIIVVIVVVFLVIVALGCVLLYVFVVRRRRDQRSMPSSNSTTPTHTSYDTESNHDSSTDLVR